MGQSSQARAVPSGKLARKLGATFGPASILDPPIYGVKNQLAVFEPALLWAPPVRPEGGDADMNAKRPCRLDENKGAGKLDGLIGGDLRGSPGIDLAGSGGAARVGMPVAEIGKCTRRLLEDGVDLGLDVAGIGDQTGAAVSGPRSRRQGPEDDHVLAALVSEEGAAGLAQAAAGGLGGDRLARKGVEPDARHWVHQHPGRGSSVPWVQRSAPGRKLTIAQSKSSAGYSVVAAARTAVRARLATSSVTSKPAQDAAG